MAIDIVLVNLAMIIALQLIHDMNVPVSQYRRYANLWPIMTAFCLFGFWITRMYKTLWAYAGVDNVAQIAIGTAVGVGATYAFCSVMMLAQPNPNRFMLLRSTYIIFAVILLLLMFTARFSFRIIERLGKGGIKASDGNKKRVMIVGAGWAAASVARDLLTAGGRYGTAAVAVDDDVSKSGTRMGRVPVKHGTHNLPEYARQYGVDEIIIAIPSASPQRLREIIEICMTTGCRLKMLPGLRDVTDGQAQAGKAREINISDMLFREEVKLDNASICGYIEGQTVLVTGGGGSIGSELCRQIARFNPALLIIFDIYENNAYVLQNELKLKYGDALRLEVVIGSVRDAARLDQIFCTYRPGVVFHTAAHKHVPLMETNPGEAVKNNVFGTLNVALCADKYKADRMVLISSDKAVNPANIYGATKRVTELIMQYVRPRSKTSFMTVRFGNVLGSNGSVIPVFQQQIAAGGPVLVTHPDIIRYFMTISEAAQLVLQASAVNESGAVYVLEMGTPVKIADLARTLIRLSGYEPDVDIKIEYTALRPGDKMYEELIMPDERGDLKKTAFDKIMVAHPCEVDGEAFAAMLDRLRSLAADEPDRLAESLKELVPTFEYSGV